MFNPVNDKILNSNTPLTKYELNLINESVDEINNNMELCGVNDGDVIDYYINLLEQYEQRILNSMESKHVQTK